MSNGWLMKRMGTQLERSPANLYEEDFYVWVLEQAELLRQRRFEDLDLERLIDEVDDLGRSERATVMSHARAIIEHLLKLEHSPARDARSGWRREVLVHRDDLAQRITPTLRRHLQEELPALYRRARKIAQDGLEGHGEYDAAAALPKTCPYSLEQVTGDWLPGDPATE